MSEKPVTHYNAVDSDIFQSDKDLAEFTKLCKEAEDAKAKVEAEPVQEQRASPAHHNA